MYLVLLQLCTTNIIYFTWNSSSSCMELEENGTQRCYDRYVGEFTLVSSVVTLIINKDGAYLQNKTFIKCKKPNCWDKIYISSVFGHHEQGKPNWLKGKEYLPIQLYSSALYLLLQKEQSHYEKGNLIHCMIVTKLIQHVYWTNKLFYILSI